jgi:hypothetical protein
MTIMTMLRRRRRRGAKAWTWPVLMLLPLPAVAAAAAAAAAAVVVDMWAGVVWFQFQCLTLSCGERSSRQRGGCSTHRAQR